MFSRVLIQRVVTGAVAAAALLLAAAGVAPAADLVSHWGLNGSGVEPVGGHDAVALGSGAYEAGYLGLGWKGTSATSVVSAPDHPELDVNQFTIAGWFRLDSQGSLNETMIWKGNSLGQGVTTPFSIGVYGTSGGANSRKIFAGLGDGVAPIFVTSTSLMPFGAFTHVALTNDGSMLRLYLNGVLEASTPHSLTPLNSAYNFQMGGIENGALTNWFRGVVDEVQLYDFALPDSLIGFTAAPAIPAGGLPVARLGAATLVSDGDSLVISGIGESGADGARLLIGNFTGLEFDWGEDADFDVPADSGAQIELTIRIAVPDTGLVLGAKDPIGGIKTTKSAKENREEIACDFSELGASACTLILLDDGVVQYEALVPTTTVVEVYPPPPGPVAAKINSSTSNIKTLRTLPGGGVDFTWTTYTMRYAGAHPMIVQGNSYNGDAIVWKRVGGAETAEVREVQLRAKTPPGAPTRSMTVKAFEPIIHDCEWIVSGGALVEALPGVPALLKVTADGDGADDEVCGPNDSFRGIADLEKETGDRRPVAYLGATYSGLDPGGAWPDGAEMAWHAEGMVDGVEGVGLGQCKAKKDVDEEGRIALEADFSDISPADTVLVEAYGAGGALLYSGVTTTGQLAVADRFPDAVRYDIATGQEGIPGYSLEWDPPVTVTIGGTDYPAITLNGLPPGTPVEGRSRQGAPPVGASAGTGPWGVTSLPVRVRYIPEYFVTATIAPDIETAVPQGGGFAQAGAPPRMTVWPSPGRGPVSFALDVLRDARLALDIYDVSGRRVRRLADRALAAGRHTFAWDGRNEAGAPAAPGVYFARARIDAGASAATGRFVLAR